MKIIDKNGTLCINNNDVVKLTVNEGNEIAGPKEVKAAAGIATFLVKTGDVSKLTINANSTIGKASASYTLSD